MTDAGWRERYVSISVCAIAHGGGARNAADTLALAAVALVLAPATVLLGCELAAELTSEEEEFEEEECEEFEDALCVADAVCGARAGGVHNDRFLPFASAVVNSARVYHRASSNSWNKKENTIIENTILIIVKT